MLKATDYIARYLYRRGVKTVFELPGGMITHLLNSLYEFQKIRILSVHHEQAAAFAADATGRLTGVPGVAMATSGPGATPPRSVGGRGCPPTAPAPPTPARPGGGPPGRPA